MTKYPYHVEGPYRGWGVTADGLVARTDLTRTAPAYATPSGEWRIVGAVVYNNFGNVVVSYGWDYLKTLIDAGTLQWTFKNGKQRIYINDFDHGTMRTWIDPKGYRVVRA